MAPVVSLQCRVQTLYLVLYQFVGWTVMVLIQMYVNNSMEAETMLHVSNQTLIPAFFTF